MKLQTGKAEKLGLEFSFNSNSFLLILAMHLLLPI